MCAHNLLQKGRPFIMRLQQLSATIKRRARSLLPATARYCNFEYSALACFKDWNIGVSVFPEGEQVFVGSECPNAGAWHLSDRELSGKFPVTSLHS
jgi:hypothetical protein